MSGKPCGKPCALPPLLLCLVCLLLRRVLASPGAAAPATPAAAQVSPDHPSHPEPDTEPGGGRAAGRGGAGDDGVLEALPSMTTTVPDVKTTTAEASIAVDTEDKEKGKVAPATPPARTATASPTIALENEGGAHLKKGKRNKASGEKRPTKQLFPSWDKYYDLFGEMARLYGAERYLDVDLSAGHGAGRRQGGAKKKERKNGEPVAASRRSARPLESDKLDPVAQASGGVPSQVTSLAPSPAPAVAERESATESSEDASEAADETEATTVNAPPSHAREQFPTWTSWASSSRAAAASTDAPWQAGVSGASSAEEASALTTPSTLEVVTQRAAHLFLPADLQPYELADMVNRDFDDLVLEDKQEMADLDREDEVESRELDREDADEDRFMAEPFDSEVGAKGGGHGDATGASQGDGEVESTTPVEDLGWPEPSKEELYVSEHENPPEPATRPNYTHEGMWSHPPPELGIEFIPLQQFTQVRRYETVSHHSPEDALAEATTDEEYANAPRLREVVSHRKTVEVYSEEGYEDAGYDHGGYNKEGEHHEVVPAFEATAMLVKTPTELEDTHGDGDTREEYAVDADPADSQARGKRVRPDATPAPGAEPPRNRTRHGGKNVTKGSWGITQVVSDDDTDKVLVLKEGGNITSPTSLRAKPPRPQQAGRYAAKHAGALLAGNRTVMGIAVPPREPQAAAVTRPAVSASARPSAAPQSQPQALTSAKRRPRPARLRKPKKPKARPKKVPKSPSPLLGFKYPAERKKQKKGKKNNSPLAKAKRKHKMKEREKKRKKLYMLKAEREKNGQKANEHAGSKGDTLPAQPFKEGNATSGHRKEFDKLIEKNHQPPLAGDTAFPSKHDPAYFTQKLLETVGKRPEFETFLNKFSPPKTDRKPWKHFDNGLSQQRAPPPASWGGKLRGPSAAPSAADSPRKAPEPKAPSEPSPGPLGSHSVGGDGGWLEPRSDALDYYSPYTAWKGSKSPFFHAADQRPDGSSQSSARDSVFADVQRRIDALYDSVAVAEARRSKRFSAAPPDKAVAATAAPGRTGSRAEADRKLQSRVLAVLRLGALLSKRAPTATPPTDKRVPGALLRPDVVKIVMDLARLRARAKARKQAELQGKNATSAMDSVVGKNSTAEDPQALPSNVLLRANLTAPTNAPVAEASANSTGPVAQRAAPALWLYRNAATTAVLATPEPTTEVPTTMATYDELNEVRDKEDDYDDDDSEAEETTEMPEHDEGDPEWQHDDDDDEEGDSGRPVQAAAEMQPSYLLSQARLPVDRRKYPFYQAPETERLTSYTPLRYALNPYDVPVKTEGGMEFYESRKVHCEGPRPPGKVVPVRAEDGAWNESPQPEGPRLASLGDVIGCMRRKLFGADPLDNPFFHETSIGLPQETAQVGLIVDAVGTPPPRTFNQLGFYNDILANIHNVAASGYLAPDASDVENQPYIRGGPGTFDTPPAPASPAAAVRADKAGAKHAKAVLGAAKAPVGRDAKPPRPPQDDDGPTRIKLSMQHQDSVEQGAREMRAPADMEASQSAAVEYFVDADGNAVAYRPGSRLEKSGERKQGKKSVLYHNIVRPGAPALPGEGDSVEQDSSKRGQQALAMEMRYKEALRNSKTVTDARQEKLKKEIQKISKMEKIPPMSESVLRSLGSNASRHDDHANVLQASGTTAGSKRKAANSQSSDHPKGTVLTLPDFDDDLYDIETSDSSDFVRPRYNGTSKQDASFHADAKRNGNSKNSHEIKSYSFSEPFDESAFSSDSGVFDDDEDAVFLDEKPAKKSNKGNEPGPEGSSMSEEQVAPATGESTKQKAKVRVKSVLMGMKGDSMIEVPMNSEQIDSLKDALKKPPKKGRGSKMKGAASGVNDDPPDDEEADQDAAQESDQDHQDAAQDADKKAAQQSSEQPTLPRPITFEEFKQTLSPEELAFFTDDDDEDDDDGDDEDGGDAPKEQDKPKKQATAIKTVEVKRDPDEDDDEDDDDIEDLVDDFEKDTDEGRRLVKLVANVETDGKPEEVIQLIKGSNGPAEGSSNDDKKNVLTFFEIDYEEPDGKTAKKKYSSSSKPAPAPQESKPALSEKPPGDEVDAILDQGEKDIFFRDDDDDDEDEDDDEEEEDAPASGEESPAPEEEASESGEGEKKPAKAESNKHEDSKERPGKGEVEGEDSKKKESGEKEDADPKEHEESEDAADDVPTDVEEGEDDDDDGEDDDHEGEADSSSPSEAMTKAETSPFRSAEDKPSDKGEPEKELEQPSKPIEVQILGSDSKETSLNVTEEKGKALGAKFEPKTLGSSLPAAAPSNHKIEGANEAPPPTQIPVPFKSKPPKTDPVPLPSLTQPDTEQPVATPVALPQSWTSPSPPPPRPPPASPNPPPSPRPEPQATALLAETNNATLPVAGRAPGEAPSGALGMPSLTVDQWVRVGPPGAPSRLGLGGAPPGPPGPPPPLTAPGRRTESNIMQIPLSVVPASRARQSVQPLGA